MGELDVVFPGGCGHGNLKEGYQSPLSEAASLTPEGPHLYRVSQVEGLPLVPKLSISLTWTGPGRDTCHAFPSLLCCSVSPLSCFLSTIGQEPGTGDPRPLMILSDSDTGTLSVYHHSSVTPFLSPLS